MQMAAFKGNSKSDQSQTRAPHDLTLIEGILISNSVDPQGKVWQSNVQGLIGAAIMMQILSLFNVR